MVPLSAYAGGQGIKSVTILASVWVPDQDFERFLGREFFRAQWPGCHTALGNLRRP